MPSKHRCDAMIWAVDGPYFRRRTSGTCSPSPSRTGRPVGCHNVATTSSSSWGPYRTVWWGGGVRRDLELVALQINTAILLPVSRPPTSYGQCAWLFLVGIVLFARPCVSSLRWLTDLYNMTWLHRAPLWTDGWNGQRNDAVCPLAYLRPVNRDRLWSGIPWFY